jgi:hypothetical protein
MLRHHPFTCYLLGWAILVVVFVFASCLRTAPFLSVLGSKVSWKAKMFIRLVPCARRVPPRINIISHPALSQVLGRPRRLIRMGMSSTEMSMVLPQRASHS